MQYQLNPMSDIQILTPMHKGNLGTTYLNQQLQKALNPNSSHGLAYLGTTFYKGDKVIQMKNNYDLGIYNGDIGKIRSVDLKNQTLHIQFDEQMVAISNVDLDDIQLAYALTVHKSQGSEYPVVILPVVMQHFHMLDRNLIYTAVTRARKLAVLWYEKQALSTAISTLKSQQRLTGLKHRIQEAMKSNLESP